jgi:hypothetical protein
MRSSGWIWNRFICILLRGEREEPQTVILLFNKVWMRKPSPASAAVGQDPASFASLLAGTPRNAPKVPKRLRPWRGQGSPLATQPVSPCFRAFALVQPVAELRPFRLRFKDG